MTPTYDLLDSTTLSSSASSVTFSSINQSYRDLVVAISATGTTTANITLTLNGNTAFADYPVVFMGADSANNTYTQATDDRDITFYARLTTNVSNHIVQFMDYSVTDKHKLYLSRSNNSSDGVHAQAGRFESTAALTSIGLAASTGDFTSGSTFHLYGIKA